MLEALLGGAIRHPDMLRVLLLARTREAVPVLSDTVLPHLRRVETLRPVGEAGDRQRWYGQAVRAYARTLRVPPPDLPERPVGSDEDTLLVLHARALLAVLGRTGTRTQSPSELITELVALEQRGWSADQPRLPAGCDVDTLAEAVTVLLESRNTDRFNTYLVRAHLHISYLSRRNWLAQRKEGHAISKIHGFRPADDAGIVGDRGSSRSRRAGRQSALRTAHQRSERRRRQSHHQPELAFVPGGAIRLR